MNFYEFTPFILIHKLNLHFKTDAHSFFIDKWVIFNEN